jgi:hypothetical protein
MPITLWLAKPLLTKPLFTKPSAASANGLAVAASAMEKLHTAIRLLIKFPPGYTKLYLAAL